MALQQTLTHSITFQGVGVHSGAYASIKLNPAPENTGIVIVSSDETQRVSIGTVVPMAAMHATVIVHQGWKISTIEHVMAALGMMGVDNVIITLQGDEFPILDGSSLPFVQKIAQVGCVEQTAQRVYLTPRKKLVFNDDKGRRIEIEPAIFSQKDNSYDTSLSLTYTAKFEHPLIGAQKYESTITCDTFVDGIAPARTFGFLFQLPFLRKNGLAQGTTLGNTVVVGDEEYLNDPRFADEFVRHKVLDLLGDMVLLGKPLAGNVIAHKTGHSFNRVVVQHYLDNPEEWVTIQ